MNETERLQYLQNILAIAYSDNELAVTEQKLFEGISKAIGAKKSEVKRAENSASDHKIDLVPIARFSFRVRNLEDMIEVALADGELQEVEKKLLINAANSIGVTQEQVKKVVTEAKERRRSAPSNCPSCGSVLDAQVRFCPKCGVSVKEAPMKATKTLELTVAKKGFTIAFAESTAAGFEEALSLSRKLPTFQEVARGKKNWYAISVQDSDFQTAIEVASKLHGMRNREVYVNGQKLDWKDVFGFTWCAAEREKSYRPDRYCFGIDDHRFNIWGCKLLDADWTEWAEWLSYGRFINNTTYEFDIGKISHEILERMERVRYCPYLRRRLIAALLKRFPSQVKITRGGDWKHRESAETDPRAVRMKVEVDYGGGMWETQVVPVSGVAPLNASLGLQLIRDAATECGIMGLNSKALGAR